MGLRIGVMLRHLGDRGGMVTYSNNLLGGFAREGASHEFHLLYSDKAHLGSHDQPDNFFEHVIPGQGKMAWDHWSVARAAERLNLDVIFNPKLSVPLFSRRRRVFVLRPEQFVHPEMFAFWDRRYFKFFMPWFCNAASKVIAPAQTAFEHIVRYVGVDPTKLVVVHEGCGDHFYAPTPHPRVLEEVRAKYSLPPEYVLFVGGLHPVKNFRRLVQAFALVYPRCQVPLVVVGFNRLKFEQDLAYAQNHELARHIHFPGFVEDLDMPHIYRMASALFFPSVYEGFGIPITEAMATGCPVVTTKLGSPPEVAGGAAVLVDPLNVEDMAAGLQRILEDNALREDLVARGRDRAPYFQFDRVARDTLKVFEQVAGA